MASPTRSKLFWTCVPELDTTRPTIIFLHAAWMSSSMFEETIATISSVFPNVNFLSVDVNGHGKTVAGRKTFTLWDQASDVVGLMDELNIPKAIFVGISMGSLIALRLALAHPSRTQALILVAVTSTAAPPSSIASITQLRDLWASTPSPSEDVMNAAIRSWGGDPDVDGVRAKTIKRHWVERHSGSEAVNAVLDSLNVREDLRERLGEVKGKVLIVHGKLDETWKLEEAEIVRDGLSNADVEFRVVSGGEHLVIGMRDSEDVAEWIEGFVKKVLAEA